LEEEEDEDEDEDAPRDAAAAAAEDVALALPRSRRSESQLLVPPRDQGFKRLGRGSEEAAVAKAARAGPSVSKYEQQAQPEPVAVQLPAEELTRRENFRIAFDKPPPGGDAAKKKLRGIEKCLGGNLAEEISHTAFPGAVHDVLSQVALNGGIDFYGRSVAFVDRSDRTNWLLTARVQGEDGLLKDYSQRCCTLSTAVDSIRRESARFDVRPLSAFVCELVIGSVALPPAAGAGAGGAGGGGAGPMPTTAHAVLVFNVRSSKNGESKIVIYEPHDINIANVTSSGRLRSIRFEIASTLPAATTPTRANAASFACASSLRWRVIRSVSITLCF